MKLLVQIVHSEYHNEEYFAYLDLTVDLASQLLGQLRVFRELKEAHVALQSLYFQDNSPLFYQKQFDFDEDLSEEENEEMDNFDDLFEKLGEKGYLALTKEDIPKRYAEASEEEETELLADIDLSQLVVMEEGFAWVVSLEHHVLPIETVTLPWSLLQQVM